MGYPKISLKEISQANFRDCIRLEVSKEQEAWVAPNLHSIAEAYVNRRLTPLAIYDGSLIARDLGPDDKMVGFLMFQVWDEVAFLTRLMVGPEYQGRGYARAALVEFIRRMRLVPEVRIIATSVVPENEAATKLYESLGFVDSPWPPDEPDGERYLMLDRPPDESRSGGGSS